MATFTKTSFSSSAKGESTLKWKADDAKAQKNGDRRAVFWVQKVKSSKDPLETDTVPTFAGGPNATTIKKDKFATGDWGTGKPKFQTGTVYQGEWQDNLKHGYGIQLYADGRKYDGEWARNKREGHGVFWVPAEADDCSGHSKKGASQSASLSGTSTLKNTHARVSQLMSGTSDSESASQLRKVYAGHWRNDKKEGLGVFYYKNGDRYEGEWMEDMRHGKGTMYFADGSIYIGQWASDLRCGAGTFTVSNGDVYEGEWVNDKKEGPGIYHYKAKNKVYHGEWVSDVAKCGVYADIESEEAKQFEKETEEKWMTRLKGDKNKGMPELSLLAPDEVLSSTIEAIRKARETARNIPYVDLQSVFEEAHLDDLRRIFFAADRGQESLTIANLKGLMQDAGLDIPPEELRQIIQDIQPLSSASASNSAINAAPLDFTAFVKAVHLAECNRAAQVAAESAEIETIDKEVPPRTAGSVVSATQIDDVAQESTLEDALESARSGLKADLEDFAEVPRPPSHSHSIDPKVQFEFESESQSRSLSRKTDVVIKPLELSKVSIPFASKGAAGQQTDPEDIPTASTQESEQNV